MAFMDKPIAVLAEADLLALIGLPEGMSLEFKRQLDIDTPEQRRELAKDWSAMANAAGGRLIYGMDEERLPDDSRVAKGINRLTEKAAISRVADIVATLIQPQIRFDLKDVAVSDGFVLVVEIRSANDLDLHMAAHPKGGRFFRRTTNGVVPMSESEVRSAYLRIGELRASLDQRVQALIAQETDRRRLANTSFFIIPLWGRPNLIEPQRFTDLHRTLYQDVVKDFELKNCSSLALKHDGYRDDDGGFLPPSMPVSRRYLAILKSGVHHWSTAWNEDTQVPLRLSGFRFMIEMLQLMVLAKYMLGEAGYRGAVRLSHRMRCPQRWSIDQNLLDSNKPGSFVNEVAEFDLTSGKEGWGIALKNLIDPYYHESGIVECGFIRRDGVIPATHSKSIPVVLDQYLAIERA